MSTMGDDFEELRKAVADFAATWWWWFKQGAWIGLGILWLVVLTLIFLGVWR